MKYFPLAISIASLTALTACGDGTPFQDDGPVPVGTVEFADGVYTITQGDTEVVLDEDDAIALQADQQTWIDGNARAQLFESDNAMVVGGVTADGTPFAALSGSVGDNPTGDATFTGGYTVLTADDFNSGDLTLVYDLETGALTNDGGALTVDAIATEVNITGTVEFAGESGNLEGNFFGEDEVAGAFTGDAIGGIIHGTADE